MKRSNAKKWTYEKAGVPHLKGDEGYNRKISSLIRSTHVQGVMGNSLGFASLFDLKKTGIKDPLLVASPDGVGTKLELARLLGGEVGATRPPVDEGYICRERQIGQTGVICRPEITLAFGISGAFHFLVGIEESGTVIAINTDPKAPIFENADYYAEADALELIELLIDIIQRRATESEEPIALIKDMGLYQSESM